jgi:hypothetical protein
MQTDLIQFLPHPHRITFTGVLIEPLPDFITTHPRWAALADKDGFLYPAVAVDPDETEDDIVGRPPSRFGKPFAIWRIGASHRIEVTSTPMGDFRQEDGAFLMHAIGYLYGYRLQFHDWHFDGRLPFTRNEHHVYVSTAAAESFLDCAYYNWRLMRPGERKAVINILYMHSRAPMYEQTWERFMVEYMVFDALYNVVSSTKNRSASSHAERIEVVCDALDLFSMPHRAARLVELRNDLFHEALWAKELPGHVWSDEAYENREYLRRLNQKIIPALLGYTSPYVRAEWDEWRQCSAFDR